MSNTIRIEVVKSYVAHRPEEIWTDVVIQDDYAREALYVSEIASLSTDLDVLKYALEWGGDIKRDIFSFAIEQEKGIEINGTWYDYDEWKPMYDKFYEED